MTEASDDFEHAYRAALTRYLGSGNESGRVEAYELGRRAVAEGISLLELAALHRVVEAGWFARSHGFKADYAEATQFFLEALSTFDMAQRGFWEAQDRVRAERDHVEQLQELNEAVVAITTCTDYSGRLVEITERARTLVKAESAAIFARRSLTAQAVTASVPSQLHDHAVRAQQGGGPIRGSEAGLPWLTVPMPDSNADGPASILVWGGCNDFGPTQEGLLVQLAQFASISLDMSWQLEREREAAVTLQESLLPLDLPQVDGLSLARRYVPSGPGNKVGGDWYDVITTENGDTAFMVGDVAGHDLRAAALMGQLRVAIQAYVMEGYSPTEVLDHADLLLPRIDKRRLATLVYVVMEHASRLLRIANAGHPPPLLVNPRGEAAFLTGGLSVPLGVGAIAAPRRDAVYIVEPGSYLLLYSDGLVDNRSSTSDDPFGALAAAAANFTGGPDELCDRVLSLVPGERNDDICVLAIAIDRIGESIGDYPLEQGRQRNQGPRGSTRRGLSF